jgi:hypothetical protein
MAPIEIARSNSNAMSTDANALPSEKQYYWDPSLSITQSVGQKIFASPQILLANISLDREASASK